MLVTESTYGDRVHSDDRPGGGARRGDPPGRQARRGRHDPRVRGRAHRVGAAAPLPPPRPRRIPDIPIYLNSPMAVDVAGIYERYPKEHRLDAAELERMYSIATRVRTVDDSKLLNLRGGPMVLISASGMITGGRILHHLQAYAPDPRNAVVLTGFQAVGTRGAALLAGARSLRIFGEDVPIRAEVVSIESMSAHADADEIMAWLRAAPAAPTATFVTHGEPAASDALRARIKRELGWQVRVPEHGETVDIGTGTFATLRDHDREGAHHA